MSRIITSLVMRLISIGVKSSRKPEFSVEYNRWLKWDENLINAKMRRITRLVIILDIDSLEEFFGYQVTLYILMQLRFQQLFLERLNKPSGKDMRRPNKGDLKYGIRVQRNVKEAAHFDEENRNLLWLNAITKELYALVPMSVFKKLPSSLKNARAGGYQFSPLWIILMLRYNLGENPD